MEATGDGSGLMTTLVSDLENLYEPKERTRVGVGTASPTFREREETGGDGRREEVKQGESCYCGNKVLLV